MEILKRLVKEEEGQGMVEYVLIIGVISLVIVAVSPTLSNAIAGFWTRVANAINPAA